ncbi:MAG: hypothetical protein NVV63_00365 [Opitutus sp.]|nr:hypothetical protein [Opitutus sp.]
MRIAERRAACAREIGELVRPLATVDRVVGTWRRVAPVASVAAVPASIAFTQFVLPRLHGARKLLRWAPVALKAARVVSGFLRK